MYRGTQRKDASSPPPSLCGSGDSSSTSKGRWHTLEAAYTGGGAAPVLGLAPVEGRKTNGPLSANMPWSNPNPGSRLPTGVVKFTLKQFLSETLIFLSCYYCCMETCLKHPLRWKTRGELLPALPLCTLPARTKSKESEPRDILGWPDFLKSPGTPPQPQGLSLKRQ